ncbi:27737_t:CDS:2, partial [Gigaspora margarita]
IILMKNHKTHRYIDIKQSHNAGTKKHIDEHFKILFLISTRDKKRFWNSIADKINLQFDTAYTWKQCNEKFLQLVRDFNVNTVVANVPHRSDSLDVQR